MEESLKMEETKRMEEGPMAEKVSPLKEVEQNIDNLLKKIKYALNDTIKLRLLITRGNITGPEVELAKKDRPVAEGRIDEMKLKLDECIGLISDVKKEHNEIINQVA